MVILDRKGSHRWALGMPGVDYCTRPEQMHSALVRLATLADERNVRWWRWPAAVGGLVFVAVAVAGFMVGAGLGG